MRRSPVTLALALIALLLAPAIARATAPANTTMPSITGSARAGQTLTRDTGTWSGTGTIAYTQRWQRCDATGAECVTLPATTPTYPVVDQDVGSTIRVLVTATNPDGVAVATSAATAVVTGTPPSNTSAPTVTGNARAGQTLTGGKGTWTGTTTITYAYEWRRCDDAGSNCDAIAGATDATYLLQAADIDSTIRLRVTATNPAGSTATNTAATAAVGPAAPPVNTAVPTVSGTTRDGSTLSTTYGTWTGATTIGYARRWQRCNALGMSCLDTAVTAQSYPLTAADIGSTLRMVVTATNPDGVATATSAVTDVVVANPPANTVIPNITGAARQGQVLTATNGTWTGTAPITYQREWRRCDSAGATCVAIAGETAASYTLTAADLGKTIRFVITGTNDVGSGVGTSNATTAIGPPQPPINTALPTVSGSMIDGQTLTSGTGTWTGVAAISYGRHWLRCDAQGANCADTGSIAPTYKLTPADVAATMRFSVVATNADGTATAVSDPSPVIAPLIPTNTVKPTTAPTAKDGITLTAANGTWQGTTPMTFTYQWLQCNNAGAGCTGIVGATAQTYTINSGDIGLTVRVEVTAHNAAGVTAVQSAASAIVAPVAPTNVVAPQISGTARDGSTLTATSGTWNGSGPIGYAFQWQRCSSAGASCVNIAAATASTYSLAPADVGSTLKVKVTATNAAGNASNTSAVTLPVTARPPTSTAPPVVTGTPADRSVLSASQGTWTGTPTLVMTYRWERCDALLACNAIAAATAQTYTLTSADVGFAVRAVVTATNGGGTASAASDPTPSIAPVVPVNNTLPAISGTARDGSSLTATTGTWSGSAPMTYGYQWRRCDAAGAGCVNIAGANSATLALTPADVGSSIRAVITATNGGGATPATSGFTQVVAALAPSNTVAPTISGTARDGRTLTADPGDWGGTPPMEWAYQWRRCDATAKCTDIDGAAAQSYVLTTADAGFTIRAVVKATNGGGTSSATTAATGVVQTNPPVNHTPPGITGSVVDGELLTASDGTWTGVVTIGYDHRWWRCDVNGVNCGVIPAATDSTYRVSGTDVGLTIEVEVIARNAGGSTSAFSDASPVGQPAAPRNTDLPVVSGRHGVGELLQATRGSWVGSPTLVFAYQWQRCLTDGSGCTDLPGEDSDAYRLTEDDLGVTIRVRLTATNDAGSASARSAASAVVRDDPPALVSAPAVTGALIADTIALQADPGTWGGATPMTATYQWLRCDAFGGACSEIDHATSRAYTPVTGDVASTLRIEVTMDNGVGLATATSAPSAIVSGAPPRNTAVPVVTAAGLLPGKDLTGSTGTWAGASPIALAQQWLRCDIYGADCVAIADASAVKYSLVPADIGHSLRLRVTATNATTSTSAVSSKVGPITAVPPSTAAKPKVTLDGKPQVGSILRADPGNWAGTAPLAFAYQWLRCAGTSDCRMIDGATGPEYTATTADVGRTLRVTITGSNTAGDATADSAVTSMVSGVVPVGSTKPVVKGTLTDGHTLTADTGAWGGTAPFTYTYAWERCTSAGCKPVKGAEAATYKLGAEDVGNKIAVKVTAKNTYGKADAESLPTSATVRGTRPTRATQPLVSRLPTVLEPGLKLKGHDGTWRGTAPMTYTYQWLRCDAFASKCRLLKGATAAIYVLRKRDLKGARLKAPLRLAVTATNAAGERTALSKPVGNVRRHKPPVRVGLTAASVTGRRLSIALTCKAGTVPCAGSVVVGHHKATVAVPAGQSGTALVSLGKAEATKLGRRLRVRFRSTGRASGRSVSARVRVTRPAATGTPSTT